MLTTVLAVVAGFVCLEFVLRLTAARRLRQFAQVEYAKSLRSPRSHYWVARIRSGSVGTSLTMRETLELMALYSWQSFLRSASGLPPRPATAAQPTADWRDRPTARVLGALRWFCGRETRDLIDLVRADLARDRREMLAEGRGSLFIWFQQTVVEWREILGIAGRFVLRLVEAANPLAKLIDRQ